MDSASNKPLVSIIVPAYNEAALIEENLKELHVFLSAPERKYRSEVLIVNDGSSDDTGVIADRFASEHPMFRVLHHPINFGLGQALKFGFANTSGDYVVTIDVDLSYDVNHIDELVEKIRQSYAKIVLASPYMRGGTIKNVPKIRQILSVLGNRFLRIFLRGHFSTMTSLVRVYDGPFIRSLDLRSMGMDIMPETLYKSMVLHAKIEESPARLDWGPQLKYGQHRTSSMRVFGHVFSTILSGFIFRPFLFLVVPGLVVGVFAIYVNFWMVLHFFESVSSLKESAASFSMSAAFADAYREFPHTFIIGFLSLMLAIQLIGLGLLAVQAKHYFEDLFHLGSTRLRDIRQRAE